MTDPAILVDGTGIASYVRSAKFLTFATGHKRGANLTIPHRHGEHSDPDKWFTAVDLLLEAVLKFDTPEQHLDDLALLFGKTSGLTTVQQTDPNKGDIRAQVELLADPFPGQQPLVWLFPLRNPKGFWEAVVASSATGTPPSVTTGGNRPIDDMVLTFSGPGYAEHTDENGVVSRVTVDAAAGAGTYIVDCGARTVTKAGAPQDAYLTITQPWWMRFSPAAAQILASDVNVAVEWRSKWA